MQLFYTPDIDASHPQYFLSEEESKHAIRVLRLEAGNERVAVLDEELPKVAHTLSKAKQGTLRVDPTFLVGGSSGYNITYDR